MENQLNAAQLEKLKEVVKILEEQVALGWLKGQALVDRLKLINLLKETYQLE